MVRTDAVEHAHGMRIGQEAEGVLDPGAAVADVDAGTMVEAPRNGTASRERSNGRMKKDSIHVVNGSAPRIFSENYFYKTEAYYRTLSLEMAGEPVSPRTADVLEAYIVPLCMERAASADIPHLPWEVSYTYVPAPSLIYGLNYYSDPSQYHILREGEAVEPVLKRVTHNGKYPFCYQPLEEGAVVMKAISVLGKGAGVNGRLGELLYRVYQVFGIPIVSHVLVKGDEGYRLSSLGPVRYSRLSSPDMDFLRRAVGGYEHG